MNDHTFVNGVCTKCGCSEIAVTHFGWTCTKPQGVPYEPTAKKPFRPNPWQRFFRWLIERDRQRERKKEVERRLAEQENAPVAWALNTIFEAARLQGARSVDVKAAEFYAGSVEERCDTMWKIMQDGDKVLNEPPSGTGPNLTIRYMLPRVNAKGGET